MPETFEIEGAVGPLRPGASGERPANPGEEGSEAAGLLPVEGPEVPDMPAGIELDQAHEAQPLGLDGVDDPEQLVLEHDHAPGIRRVRELPAEPALRPRGVGGRPRLAPYHRSLPVIRMPAPTSLRDDHAPSD